MKIPKKIEPQDHNFPVLGHVAENQRISNCPSVFYCEGTSVSKCDDVSYDSHHGSSIIKISGDWSHPPPRNTIMRSSLSSMNRRHLRSSGAVPPPDDGESLVKRTICKCLKKALIAPLDDDESPAKRTIGKCVKEPLLAGTDIAAHTKRSKSLSKKSIA
jgi:hypothetical protein